MKQLMHTETEGAVTYRLWIEPEDIPVRGNAFACGDDAEDRRVEDGILARLAEGETWAWAFVIVEAEVDGRIGRDTLSCCSYRDAEEFIDPDGYWPDLKAGALRCALTETSNLPVSR